jgi:hypothetical protein
MSHYSIPLWSKLDQLNDWLDQLFQSRFERLIALRRVYLRDAWLRVSNQVFCIAVILSSFQR